MARQYTPKEPKTRLVCQNPECGTVFYLSTSYIRYGINKRGKIYGKYCSRSCSATAQSLAVLPEEQRVARDARLAQQSRDTADRRSATLKAKYEGQVLTSYEKQHGRHKHRAVAEEVLGRPLQKGKIVHHKDHNKRNNDPSNIEILPSQAEHARLHARERRLARGGTANADPGSSANPA